MRCGICARWAGSIIGCAVAALLIARPDARASSSGLPPVGPRHRTITDADRTFWSLQPVKDPPVPQVDDRGWCRNDIDRFIFAKLKAEGLSPAPEADRITLIRRATFDLTGLPPSADEVDAFVADKAPNAYENLIDRLLASPHYGERYARHWLDLVRYAESDGFKQDGYRPNVWPYRDYVIKSFNDDKPYDRFVREQLAGDELALRDPNVLVATTYLRHGMYEYNQRDVPKQWSQILDDVTDVTGDVFLGLSMGCCRCHDHKFDPLLRTDYYRLQAFFTPMLQRDDLPLASAEQQAQHDKAQAAWEAKAGSIRAEMAVIERASQEKMAAGAIKKFPAETQAILLKPKAERTPYEEQIAQLAGRQIYDATDNPQPKLSGKEKERYEALKKQLGEFESIRPKPLPKAFVATDVGPIAPPTTVPGDPDHPLDPGTPVVLDKLPIQLPPIEPTATSTGRRTALAKWIGNPRNPLTTRVITNRLWQWHFGQGLVRTSSDFGHLGELPTHPELLDWLTSRFTQGNWQMKAMHRLIMTSATYRQASVGPVPEIAKRMDPENRWLWRMNAQRLEAEEVRDAMLAVSGELQPEAGGPSVDSNTPRRTIYTKAVRNVRDPLLDAFDLPESFGCIANRNVTTTATQALLMINGDAPLKRAAALAARVRRQAPSADSASLVNTAYRLSFGRSPTAEERQQAIAFLDASENPGTAVAAPSASSESAAERPLTQTMPQRGGQAVLIRSAAPADMLHLAPSATLPTGDFTIEAYVVLESLYENAAVRVIASQWDGKQDHPGWSFGVTSEKSKYQPRNLILQLATRGVDGGKSGYEVIPSDFRLELHKAYYAAVSVKLKETHDTSVTFYLKDLTDMDAPLRSVSVPHKLTGPYATTADFVIGGRSSADAAAPNGWDGLIDEVRLSSVALHTDELLYNEGHPKSGVAGHWLLKEQPGYYKDSAGVQKDLTRAVETSKTFGAAKGASATGRAPPDAGLVDLCHVLLNSNEFLYVD